jgi:nucleotide-binding universal stress UspA family protein
MYQRLLVPTDGSDITAKALASAVSLAKLTGGSIVSVAVREPFPYSAMSEIQPVPPQEFFDAQARLAERRLAAVSSACAEAGVPCALENIEGLHPWETILATAEKHACDLIVMASHGRRGVAALLLGSETQKVLTHSEIPVLVVR